MKDVVFILVCALIVVLFAPSMADAGWMVRGSSCTGAACSAAPAERPVVSVLVKPAVRVVHAAEAIACKAVHPGTWRHQPVRRALRAVCPCRR